MGYVPPPLPPPRLNVDRFGMPRDYATYMWTVYRVRVNDDSPERRAFEEGPSKVSAWLPVSDELLMDYEWR